MKPYDLMEVNLSPGEVAFRGVPVSVADEKPCPHCGKTIADPLALVSRGAILGKALRRALDAAGFQDVPVNFNVELGRLEFEAIGVKFRFVSDGAGPDGVGWRAYSNHDYMGRPLCGALDTWEPLVLSHKGPGDSACASLTVARRLMDVRFERNLVPDSVKHGGGVPA